MALVTLVAGLLLVPTELPTAAATPYAGPPPTPTNLTVFLHNSTAPLPITGGLFYSQVLTTANVTVAPWSHTGQVDVQTKYLTAFFYLYPRLAGPLVLNGTPTAMVFANQSCTACGPGRLTLTLYSIDPNGNTTALGTPGSTDLLMVTPGSVPYPVALTYGSAIHQTLPAGWSLEARFDFSGSNTQRFGMWWGLVGSTYYPSDLNLPASSYLDVRGTSTVGSDGVPTTVLNQSVRTPVASLRADIADPLGNYDYAAWPVTYEVTDYNGALVASGTMTPYPLPGPVSPFEFNATWAADLNYSELAPGPYHFCVNATDNSNHNDALFPGLWGRMSGSCAAFQVGTRPELVTVSVVDDLNAPLVGALVRVVGLSNGTDPQGVTQFHLANGTFNVRVFWQDIVVGVQSLTVSGPTQVTIKTEVYSVTLQVVDQGSAPLEQAFVQLTHPNGSMYPTMITSGSGALPLAQIAGGTYGLLVAWHGEVVYAPPTNPPLLVSSSGVYTVTTLVYPQTFKVVEKGGAVVPRASVVISNDSNGVVVTFGVTDYSGLTSGRVPAGTFTASVYWESLLVAQVPGLKFPVATNPYVLTTSISQVTLRTVDDQGLAVPNVQLTLVSPAGLAETLTSDQAGSAPVLLAGTTYTYTATWMGIVVGSGSLAVSAPMSVVLSLKVHTLTLTARDDLGSPVGGAVVTYTTPLGQANDTVVTGGDGTMVVRVPEAAYHLHVMWEGLPVGDYQITPTSSGPVLLPLAIYRLDVVTVDLGGVALAAATLGWTTTSGAANGSGLSDATGALAVRLPTSTYQLTAFWEGVRVADLSVVVSSSLLLRLTASVAYLSISTVDDKGSVVPSATVTWSAPGGVLTGSMTTTQAGTLSTRLPAAIYHVGVAWRGVTVATMAYALNANSALTIPLSVYQVGFSAVDAHSVPVAGAEVQWVGPTPELTSGAATTDNAGLASTRLPGASYAVSVTWEGVVVYSGTLSPTASATVVLPLAVYHTDLRVLDERGAAVGGATVLVAGSGNPVHTLLSVAENGSAGLRLPGASYALTVVWMGATVYQGNLVVGNNGAASLVASVHYLTVVTLDSGGLALPGVFLQVVSAASGAPVASAFTSAVGSVFRLPGGSYYVIGTYRGTFGASAISQTINRSVELSGPATVSMTFEQAYPPYYATAEFLWLLLLLLASAVTGLVVAILLWRRREEPEASAIEGAGPEAGNVEVLEEEGSGSPTVSPGPPPTPSPSGDGGGGSEVSAAEGPGAGAPPRSTQGAMSP